MSIGVRKLLPVIVVACCAFGSLAWGAVSAFAVAPETPEVSVGSVQATGATVQGVLNPRGMGEAGSYEFLYREGNAGCAGGSKAPVPAGVAMGLQGEGVSEALSGLTPDTEYSVCLQYLVAGHEEARSPTVTFTTLPEAPVLVSAEAQGSTAVVLKGELNPAGATGTLTYQAEYNTNGTCVGSQGTPGVEVAEAKQDQVVVEAQGLEPNQQYTFCLVATDAQGEQASSGEIPAQTGAQAPVIANVSVSNVSSTEATVGGEIYPYEESVVYRVEYGRSSAYGSSSPEASIGAQHGPASIQVQLTGLTPDTEYHYRIVATSATGSERSTDATFTTGEAPLVRSGSLPDDRVFEMVTPPENENSDVYVPDARDMNGELGNGIPTVRLFQVSADGSAVAYVGDATSGGGNGESGSKLGNQFLANRTADGWSTHSIMPAGVRSDLYQGFSPDLSVGVIVAGTEAEPKDPPLAENALGEGYKVLYARATSGAAVYRPLFTNEVRPNRPAQGKSYHYLNGEFGTNTAAIASSLEEIAPVFAGGSTGFSDQLFEANDALLAGNGVLETELERDVKQEIAEGIEHDENYLYDSVDGKLSLVDVSPEGKVVTGATFGGLPLGAPNKNQPDFYGAISSDGSRVYWSSVEVTERNSNGNIYAERPTGLYLRENPVEPQSPIVNGKCSVPGDACTVRVSGGEAQYWASAADGRYAFYTEGGQLYRFDARPGVGQGSNEVLAGAGAGVVGVLGVSGDGESVYFVAKGALAPGATAQTCEGWSAGTGCNLYLINKGETRFITSLSAEDGSGVPLQGGSYTYSSGDWQAGLGTRTSRVFGDGEGIVFMSNESLSAVGYPHGYQKDGAYEVYVYDADSNSLFCASCGSTGAGVTSGYLPVSWNVTELGRWASQDGDRAFFDSRSVLSPQDTSGAQNVYEWEREGSGTCTDGSGVNGGCVFLLSGGASPSDSWLIGTGESGNDVFISTRAQLAPEDQNEMFDLYDVRVDGVKPVSAPVCTGSGCQGVPAPPPTFATPSSVTFDGIGNFEPSVTSTAKSKTKAKKLSRAQKLAVALRACRGESKRRRASCEARARRRYGLLDRKARNGSGTAVKGKK